jgi:hypothetical protein
VDIRPFIYTLALGNHTWRTNGSDIVNYLRGREAINDAILSSSQPTPQRRLSTIPLAHPFGSSDNDSYQPYVFHTMDEYVSASVGGGAVPSHAIAFRTVDITQNYTAGPTYPNNYPPPYGGGKLGVYSYWNVCAVATPPIQPESSNQQYEFYNYSFSNSGGMLANPGETGNSYNGTSLPQAYLTNFNNFIVTELCAPIALRQSAINTAFCSYVSYLTTAGYLTCSSGEPPACNS